MLLEGFLIEEDSQDNPHQEELGIGHHQPAICEGVRQIKALRKAPRKMAIKSARMSRK
jgi:hypothetical protein